MRFFLNTRNPVERAGPGGLLISEATAYQLQGDTAKLTEHVGHEVQITGSTSGGAGDSANSASAGAASQPSLNVKSIFIHG